MQAVQMLNKLEIALTSRDAAAAADNGGTSDTDYTTANRGGTLHELSSLLSNLKLTTQCPL